MIIMFCPLKSNYKSGCDGEACAWWTDKQCVIVDIAISLRDCVRVMIGNECEMTGVDCDPIREHGGPVDSAGIV